MAKDAIELASKLRFAIEQKELAAKQKDLRIEVERKAAEAERTLTAFLCHEIR
jgi:hypothetical protein